MSTKLSSTVACPRLASLRITRATDSASCRPTLSFCSSCDSRVISAARRPGRSASAIPRAPGRHRRRISFLSIVTASSRASSGRPWCGRLSVSSCMQWAGCCDRA